MSDYNKYVIAVNKIFNIVVKMKVEWPNQDNISYIESIEEYKQVVVDSVKMFSTDKKKTPDNVTEELGND